MACILAILYGNRAGLHFGMRRRIPIQCADSIHLVYYLLNRCFVVEAIGLYVILIIGPPGSDKTVYIGVSHDRLTYLAK